MKDRYQWALEQAFIPHPGTVIAVILTGCMCPSPLPSLIPSDFRHYWEGFSIDSVTIVYVFGYSRLALSLELFHPKLDRSLGNPTTFAQVLRILSRTYTGVVEGPSDRTSLERNGSRQCSTGGGTLRVQETSWRMSCPPH